MTGHCPSFLSRSVEPVPVLQPGLGGQQPGPRPPAGRRRPPGLLVLVSDPGLHLQPPARGVRPLLLGRAGHPVLHVVRVRPAQVRGGAGERRPAPLLRGGHLLHDRAHGLLLAQRAQRPQRGGEAGTPGEPGQTAQHPPQQSAGESRPRQRQVTISQPAGSPHASARSQKTKTEKEEKSTKPQTISINVPEHGGGRSVRVFPATCRP